MLNLGQVVKLLFFLKNLSLLLLLNNSVLCRRLSGYGLGNDPRPISFFVGQPRGEESLTRAREAKNVCRGQTLTLAGSSLKMIPIIQP